MYQDTYNTPASDEAAKGPWQDWFNGIMAANLAIDKINQFNDKSVSAEELNTMLGQALFLRGLFYLNLASIYGETIPLYDHAIATRDDYYPGNAEKGAVYAQIVADFTKAAELLPVRSKFYSKADNIGRATQGSALGFLAKAYLWRPIIEKGREAEYDKADPCSNASSTVGNTNSMPISATTSPTIRRKRMVKKAFSRCRCTTAIAGWEAT